jgi:VanZ family protein
MNTESLPKVEMTDFDKLVHLLIFGALAGLVFFENSCYFKQKVSFKTIFIGSFLFPLLFGGLIEVFQEYFISNRTGDWLDFLFDGIGIFFVFVLCRLINRQL